MTTTSDPRPLLTTALDQAGRLVDAVTVDDLDRPTPCSEFDVRTLLGHLVAVERRVVHISHGGRPFEVGSFVTDVPDDAWAAAWKESRVTLDSAMAEDGVLDRTFHHPAGDFPGRQATFAYVSEMATHGWDLAMALGRRDELDAALAAATLEPVRRFLPAEPRGGRVPFGPVVEVPDDADAYDRLVAWLGREPGWSA
jgi:uncharacterized protein (TIGR03086 family)